MLGMGSDMRTCTDKNRQAGATLIEVLVTIVVLGIVVGGASIGVLTMIRTTNQANDAARANVLVRGFADIVKELPYQRCEQTAGDTAALAELYQDNFVANEVALNDATPASDVRRSLVPHPENWNDPDERERVVATDVEVVCSPADQGVQTINYEVTSRSVTRKAQVTKLDPNFDGALTAEVSALQETSDGDSLVIHKLDGLKSKPMTRIETYIFRCDMNDPGDPEIQVTEPDHEDASCEYTARANAQTRTVGLQVIDGFGQRSAWDELDVAIPAATSPRPEVVLNVTATCQAPPSNQSATVSGSPCIANPSRNVVFQVAPPVMASGRIISYKWDFNDGGDDDRYYKSDQLTASHVYSRSGPFTVSIVPIDEVGREYIATTKTIYITRPGPPPPTAAIAATPNPAIARQTMTFNSGSSTAVSPATISNWSWNFGDPSSGVSNTSIARNPTHVYENPGNYVVTLTVTDSNGTPSTTSLNLVIGSLQSPTHPSVNLRMTRMKGCLFGFEWFGCESYADFTWTNGQSSGGDQLSYEIEWEHVSGYCFAFNDEGKTVRAGAAGTVQTFRYNFTGATDVCQGVTYQWRARTHRYSIANGSFWSNWTAWNRVTVPW